MIGRDFEGFLSKEKLIYTHDAHSQPAKVLFLSTGELLTLNMETHTTTISTVPAHSAITQREEVDEDGNDLSHSRTITNHIPKPFEEGKHREYSDFYPSAYCAVIGSEDHLYAVADAKAHHIKVVSLEDCTLRDIHGSKGNFEGQFMNVTDITSFSVGFKNFYAVCEAGNNRIQVLDERFQFVASIGSSKGGYNKGQFRNPVSVSACSHTIKISTSIKIDAEFRPSWYLGLVSKEYMESELYRDPSPGMFFVGKRNLDTRNFDLVFLNENLQVSYKIIKPSTQGGVGYQLMNDNSHIYRSLHDLVCAQKFLKKYSDRRPSVALAVADKSNNRVQILRFYWTKSEVFEPCIEPRVSIGRRELPDLMTPTAVCFSPTGELAVVDSSRGRIFILSPFFEVLVNKVLYFGQSRLPTPMTRTTTPAPGAGATASGGRPGSPSLLAVETTSAAAAAAVHPSSTVVQFKEVHARSESPTTPSRLSRHHHSAPSLPLPPPSEQQHSKIIVEHLKIENKDADGADSDDGSVHASLGPVQMLSAESLAAKCTSVSFSRVGKIAIGFNHGGYSVFEKYGIFKMGTLMLLQEHIILSVLDYLHYSDCSSARNCCRYLHNITRRLRNQWIIRPMRFSSLDHSIYMFLKYSRVYSGLNCLDIGVKLEDKNKIALCTRHLELKCIGVGCALSHNKAVINTQELQRKCAYIEQLSFFVAGVQVFGSKFMWKIEKFAEVLFEYYCETIPLINRKRPQTLQSRCEPIRLEEEEMTRVLSYSSYMAILTMFEEDRCGCKFIYEQSIFKSMKKSVLDNLKDPYDRSNVDGRMYIDPVEQYEKGLQLSLSSFKVHKPVRERNKAMELTVTDLQTANGNPVRQHILTYEHQTKKLSGLLDKMFS